MKNNKKNIPSYWIYVIVIGTVLGVALGLWLGSPLNEEGLQMNLDTVWHILLWVLFATLLHECGHLIAGFLSGYRFISFRLLNIAVVKINGSYKFQWQKMNGGIGQCLMAPNFEYRDNFPFVFYNMGGVFMNTALIIVCLALFVFNGGVNKSFLLSGILVNFVFALMNALPLKAFANDGFMVKTVSKTQACKKAYYTQLAATADMLDGKTFSQMSEKFFDFGVQDAQYPLVCNALYMQYCFLVSKGQSGAASNFIKELFENKNVMPENYANTVSVEYFNNLVLFKDDRHTAALVYNDFDITVKNAVSRLPASFTLIAKICVNMLSKHDDRQYAVDCMLVQKLLEHMPNKAEAEYLSTLFSCAKQRYRQAEPSPFEI